MTRHNIGFEVAEGLARECGARRVKSARSADVREGDMGDESVAIAWPKTFMNRSGKAVRELVEHYELGRLADMLVVVDDSELPFGKFRFRERGSSGGHRGLESIIAELGSQGFARLRIGIGRPEHQALPLEAYVLEKFTRAERGEVSGIVKQACRAVAVWIAEGPQAVMNRFN
jgi:PTH1 family peptidyl-tRNA hydrolase